MGSTKITIVRHGETEWNISMQLQGHQDSPLTKNGIKQTNLLAQTIKNRDFDLIYSSDLGRAIDTANILNKQLNLQIIPSEKLRERAFGVMEGLTREQVELKYPDIFHVYMHRNSNHQIPEGESLETFSKRVIDEIDLIAKSNVGKRLLLIAHGGVLDCVIRKIFKLKVDDKRCFTLHNSSVNTISIENEKWILEEWGNVEHLHQKEVLDENN
jgi:broad specificity phosphatase PhoE